MGTKEREKGNEQPRREEKERKGTVRTGEQHRGHRTLPLLYHITQNTNKARVPWHSLRWSALNGGENQEEINKAMNTHTHTHAPSTNQPCWGQECRERE